MKRYLTLAAAAVLGSAFSAHASTGLYLSAGAGVSFLQEADNTNRTPRVDVESTYDTGWAVSGAVGYSFSFGLRVEGEVAYRRVELDKLKINEDGGLGATLGGPSLNGLTTPADGTESALSGMVNLWYDINTGTRFTPYVGGGIGVARISLDKLTVGGVEIADDHDHVFAYQLGAGVAYALTPKISLTADYRYFATRDAQLKDISGDFDSEFRNHSVMGGVRVGF